MKSAPIHEARSIVLVGGGSGPAFALLPLHGVS